jgi:RND family efflux transporter MFP subunit
MKATMPIPDWSQRLLKRIFLALLLAASSTGAGAQSPKGAVRPALTVQVTKPEMRELGVTLSANGTVAAWQEASIGAESNGLRLADIRVDVGSVVKAGQVLAVFASDTIEAEVAQAKAALAEAEASLADARSNAERARSVANTGALSAQQIAQYQTAEKTAEARVGSARAALEQQNLRLRHTRVVASDDGIISSRTATLGAVVPQGQELFRLIRKSRLEWRAEVPSSDLAAIRPGQKVAVTAVGGSKTTGTVRLVGPTVDPQTRNALVYVDLPAGTAFKPGMFATGQFATGRKPALTVPQQAIALREGFSYVFTVNGDRVAQVQVQLGRREGDRFEVVSGLKPGQPIVASGASFLADGDTVRIAPAGSGGPSEAAAK